MPLCSLQHDLQYPRYGSNLNVHQIWKDKDNVLYIHTRILAIKKHEIFTFAATQMDLEKNP